MMQAHLPSKRSNKSSMHSTERLGSIGAYQSTSGNTQEIESTDKIGSIMITGQEQKLIRQQA